MKLGAWEIVRARLCSACVREMSDEYIFQPYGWKLEPGTCERCGARKLVALRKYTMNKKGLERMGLANEPEK